MFALESCTPMDTRKIMIPVLVSSTSREIERNSFWLARYQPAEVYITEIVLPVGFFKWLFAPLIELLSKMRMSQAERARRDADERETFACTVDSLEAPSLLLGIVEAVRKKQPGIIIILPEIGDRLGAAGLEEVKRRLSEIQ